MANPSINIPKSLTEGYLKTQEEVLEMQPKQEQLFIGIPMETTFQENRVSIVPSSVSTLVAMGHRVVVETGAGESSNFSDHEYSEAGAEIAFSTMKVYEANIILKVAPLSKEEQEWLRPNQIIISPLHLPTLSPEYFEKLIQKKVIALAMEYIQDDAGNFPIVRTLSEMAGVSAMLTAGELLTSKAGRGILLGGVSGVPPAKVVILGAGIVAEFATKTALGLGAEVRIFDNNVYKLMRIQNQVGHKLYTSTFNSEFLKQELYTCDVAIGAVHSQEGRAPVVISDDMVANMRNGSVIIDVSIDQGGVFATSRVTDHENPTFLEHGVLHYCVPNITSKTGRTASVAISNILTSLISRAQNTGSIEQLIHDNQGLQHGIYCFKGCLTNEYIGMRFGIKSTNIKLLLPSKW